MNRGERRWPRWCRISLVGAIVLTIALPVLAQAEPAQDSKKAKKKDPAAPIVAQLKDLNSTLVELRGLLLQRAQRDRERDHLQRLDTLDRNVAFLDAELRKALEERDRLSQELVRRQGQLRESQELLAAGDPETRERLGFQIPVQQEAVDRTQERIEHLDARITELRRTGQARRSQRELLEAEMQLDEPTPA
jgi:hypothetical protein